MLKNIKCDSLTIAGVNEDAFGSASDCAWVLDGSTGLSGHHFIPEAGTDAQWYANAFSDYLARTLPGSELPLRQVFQQGVAEVWDSFHRRAGEITERYDIPCCLCAALRLRGGNLEYILIGDCTLLVRFRDGHTAALHDEALSRLDANTLRLACEISQKKGLPLSACKSDILPELRRVRSLMNTERGYLSLADSPDSILRAPVGTFPLHDVRDVCLLSDGFSQYYQLFRLCADPREFMELVCRHTVGELYQRLLTAQRADAALNRFPRFKLSDDATLFYAQVEG